MKKSNHPVMVVSHDSHIPEAIRECMADRWIDIAVDLPDCIGRVGKKRYDFIFIHLDILSEKLEDDLRISDYRKLLEPLFAVSPTTDIVIVAPSFAIRRAVYAVKAGATNYIFDPIQPEELKHVTESVKENHLARHPYEYLRDPFWDRNFIHIIKTKSEIMKQVFKKVRSVAPTKTTVLLQGETGTGKGIIARLIHAHSNRKDNQFVAVHCGAIPETLIESELFGHEKGAFTGAIKRKMGKFEIAREGTLFLDEVGTVSLPMQIKLLQVLQERTFQPVGGEMVIETNARFIAATNTDLKIMADNGDFRKDLYYRLNVFPIELPPLRERKEDIPILAAQLLERLNLFHGKEVHDIHPAVMEVFMQYDWPGNIRELENLLERAYILETSALLSPESFPGELFKKQSPVARIHLNASHSLNDIRRIGIENVERQYLKEILTIHKGRMDRSAETAGISTRQLHKLLTKYGIKKDEFKR